jgi:hypothetical protein
MAILDHLGVRFSSSRREKPLPENSHHNGTTTALLRHCYGTTPMGTAMPMGVVP